jgi:hypothetical protein
LKALPTFKELHTDKNPVKLLKAIKGLTFKFDGEKEYEMSLVEANGTPTNYDQQSDLPNYGVV